MPRRIKPKGIPHSRRKVNNRAIRKHFIIVCEGTKTEPNYFEKFRVPKDVIKIELIGMGANTIQVVRRAIAERDAQPEAEVWAVFDRDSFPVADFNNALALAKRNNIQVAYSNEAFEIWYLLHFDYHNVPIPRRNYPRMLSERRRLGKPYKKNDRDMYDLLFDRQPNAIRNAERLLLSYEPHQPEKDNPCTTVHTLVEALNEFAV